MRNMQRSLFMPKPTHINGLHIKEEDVLILSEEVESLHEIAKGDYEC